MNNYVFDETVHSLEWEKWIGHLFHSAHLPTLKEIGLETGRVNRLPMERDSSLRTRPSRELFSISSNHSRRSTSCVAIMNSYLYTYIYNQVINCDSRNLYLLIGCSLGSSPYYLLCHILVNTSLSIIHHHSYLSA